MAAVSTEIEKRLIKIGTAQVKTATWAAQFAVVFF